MRTIKFRAKRKGTDDWLYFDLRKEIENDGQPSEFMMQYLSQDTVQQFTGLKDCKGKEIFEGDVVRWGMLNEHRTRVAFVEINPDIQFRILYYIVKSTSERKEGDGYIFHYGNFAYKNTEEHLEIIGNIYVNPELL